MLKRPLILKLFALLLLLDPFLRIAFISIESDFPFWAVFAKTFSLSPIDFLNYWFLFPLSGFLLLSVKVYSYIMFISIQLYSLYFHINYEPYSWPYLSANPSVTSYIFLSINMLMVAYLLTPRSREIFFDKNLRWWERGSRYTINEPCFIHPHGLNDEVQGAVVDLAFGGALLKLEKPIEKGSVVSLEFEILNKSVSIETTIVRIINRDNQVLYGTQFNFKSQWEKFKLKLLMFSISKITDYEKFR